MRPNVYFINSLWVYIGNNSDLWAHEKARHLFVPGFHKSRLQINSIAHVLVQ